MVQTKRRINSNIYKRQRQEIATWKKGKYEKVEKMLPNYTRMRAGIRALLQTPWTMVGGWQKKMNSLKPYPAWNSPNLSDIMWSHYKCRNKWATILLLVINRIWNKKKSQKKWEVYYLQKGRQMWKLQRNLPS